MIEEELEGGGFEGALVEIEVALPNGLRDGEGFAGGANEKRSGDLT